MTRPRIGYSVQLAGRSIEPLVVSMVVGVPGGKTSSHPGRPMSQAPFLASTCSRVMRSTSGRFTGINGCVAELELWNTEKRRYQIAKGTPHFTYSTNKISIGFIFQTRFMGHSLECWRPEIN